MTERYSQLDEVSAEALHAKILQEANNIDAKQQELVLSIKVKLEEIADELTKLGIFPGITLINRAPTPGSTNHQHTSGLYVSKEMVFGLKEVLMNSKGRLSFYVPVSARQNPVSLEQTIGGYEAVVVKSAGDEDYLKYGTLALNAASLLIGESLKKKALIQAI